MMLFPVGVIVALLIAFRDFRWRDAARAVVLVHLALAGVVLPWTMRNVQQMGAFVPVSTNGGVSLFYGANDRATGDWLAWERTPYWYAAVGIPYAQRVAQQVEIDRRLKAKATAWIAAHPAKWSALGVRKMALLWRKDSDAFWSLAKTYPDQAADWRVLQGIDQLYYMSVIALGLVALAVGHRLTLKRRTPLRAWAKCGG